MRLALSVIMGTLLFLAASGARAQFCPNGNCAPQFSGQSYGFMPPQQFAAPSYYGGCNGGSYAYGNYGFGGIPQGYGGYSYGGYPQIQENFNIGFNGYGQQGYSYPPPAVYGAPILAPSYGYPHHGRLRYRW